MSDSSTTQQPTEATALVPSWHAPYETPIDLSLPLHFTNVNWTDKVPFNCAGETIDSDLNAFEIAAWTQLQVRPTLTTLRRDMKVFAMPGQPETSTPFFYIVVTSDCHKTLPDLFHAVLGLIKLHFPAERYPHEDYPYLYPPKIRFFAIDEDDDSAVLLD